MCKLKRFTESEEVDQYYRKLFDDETIGLTTEQKLDKALRNSHSMAWWYAQRWDRLRELIRGTDIEEAACSIMANGTASVTEPNTASQQYNNLAHALGKTREALRECLVLTKAIQERMEPQEVIDDLLLSIEQSCAKVGVNFSDNEELTT